MATVSIAPRRLRAGPVFGWALLVASATSSAVAGALASRLFSHVPPLEVVGFAGVFGGVMLWSWRRPKVSTWPPERRSEAAVLGVIIVVNAMLLYLAIDRLPLGTTTTVEFLGPLALAVAHGGGLRDYAAATAAIAGVAVVSGAAPVFEPIGIALALGAGASWAVYIVVNRRLGRRGRPTDSLAAAFAFGGLLCVPLAALAIARTSSPEVALLLVVVALLGRVIPMGCEIFALQMLTTGAASILFAAVPALGALSGFFLLGQSFSVLQLVGLVIVVGAGLVVLGDAGP